MNGKPLNGIKVLELARVLAGPWCGQILGDLGAKVIKVERPGSGDDTRGWGPPFVMGEDGTNLSSSYFHAANRGKRSVEIDLASPEGQARIRALAAEADVVIENYKVGGLVKYGLDYASLSAVNPGLVYCSITGFGQDGPYASRPGYDFVIQAMGGMMSITGEEGGPPQKAGIAVADLFTGVYSAVAILAALHQRNQTGEGAHIDMALLDTQVAVLSNQALNWMTSHKVPKAMGNGHANLIPYQSFPTADGDLVIAIGNDKQFAALCKVLEIELREEHRTNALRSAHNAALIELLSSQTRSWETQVLADRLEAAGVPAGPINTIDQVFANPQVLARGMQIQGDATKGILPGVASPIVMNGVRMVDPIASPALGSDNDLTGFTTMPDRGNNSAGSGTTRSFAGFQPD